VKTSADPRHAPSAETLLCLHCSGSSARQWDPIAAALAPRFSVVSPELLGYGDRGGWPAGAEVTLDDEAAALRRWIGREGVHLFGHSYGGAVALQIALRWPALVRSLVLYEPVRFALLSRDPRTAEDGAAIVAVGRRIGADVARGALDEAAGRFVDYWSGDGAWQRLAPRRRQALAQRMPKVRAEFEALFADPVPAEEYGRLAMPVRLIGGSRSPRPARRVLDLLAERLPQATRVVLDGVGHMGPIEAPHRVLAALDDTHRPDALREAA
jgi:pimeloyl-ACP methyl ester carboxylesterase